MLRFDSSITWLTLWLAYLRFCYSVDVRVGFIPQQLLRSDPLLLALNIGEHVPSFCLVVIVTVYFCLFFISLVFNSRQILTVYFTSSHLYEFVDFGLLRPCNLKRLPSSEPNSGQLAKLFKVDLLPVAIFSEWAGHGPYMLVS